MALLPAVTMSCVPAVTKVFKIGVRVQFPDLQIL